MKIPRTIELHTIPTIITILLLLGSAYFFGHADGIEDCLNKLMEAGLL